MCAHDRHVGGDPRLDREVQRRDRVRAGQLLAQADLDADDAVAVAAHAVGRPIGDEVAQVVELAEERVDLPRRADVDEGEDPADERVDDVLAEPRIRVRARRARVDDRRRASSEVARAGPDREVGDAPVDVDVEVDEARDDVAVGRVDRIGRVTEPDVRLDGRDAPAGDRDVAPVVHPARRVDDRAAMDDQVVAHRSLPSSARSASLAGPYSGPIGGRATVRQAPATMSTIASAR